MPFTDKERRQWHEQKRLREQEPVRPAFSRESITQCIHCGRPFGLGEGMITDDFSLCSICDDD